MSDFTKKLMGAFNKNGEVAFLLEDGSTTDVKMFIPTGATTLDFIIANRRGGGTPVSKILTLEGQEGTGKSLLAMQMMANAQKEGGLAIYMDTEHALNTDFASRVGLDITHNFIHMFPSTVEQAFSSLFQIIHSYNDEKLAAKKEKRELDYKFIMVVWDSVTATPTKLDLEAENPDPSSSVGVKARTLSKNMQTLVGMTGRGDIAIVLVNQLRRKIGAMPLEDPWEAPGGKAIPYFSSVRIRLSSAGKLKVSSTKEVVGVKTKAKIIKNRFGPPFRTADFPIYFTHGIDDEEGILDCLVEHKKVVKSSGGSKGSVYHFKGDKKEDAALPKREFKYMLMADKDFRKRAMDLLEECLVKEMADPRKVDLELDAKDGEGS